MSSRGLRSSASVTNAKPTAVVDRIQASSASSSSSSRPDDRVDRAEVPLAGVLDPGPDRDERDVHRRRSGRGWRRPVGPARWGSTTQASGRRLLCPARLPSAAVSGVKQSVRFGSRPNAARTTPRSFGRHPFLRQTGAVSADCEQPKRPRDEQHLSIIIPLDGDHTIMRDVVCEDCHETQRIVIGESPECRSCGSRSLTGTAGYEVSDSPPA